jgi:hypothetical protein
MCDWAEGAITAQIVHIEGVTTVIPAITEIPITDPTGITIIITTLVIIVGGIITTIGDIEGGLGLEFISALETNLAECQRLAGTLASFFLINLPNLQGMRECLQTQEIADCSGFLSRKRMGKT